MATHDYVLANQSGSSFRTDLNNALAAIVSGNSSGSEPSTTYAYMIWNDTGNNLRKIRNSSNNAWITLSTLSGGAEFTDDVTFVGQSYNLVWDKSDSALEFADNAKCTFGANSDISIWHQTGNSYLTNSDGNLTLRSNGHIYLQDYDGNTMADFNDGGACEFYFDGTRKMETFASGVQLDDNLVIKDDKKLFVGDGYDLQVYHSGDDSVISKVTSPGNLLIYTANDFYLKHGTEVMLAAKDDAEVALYYDSVKTFQTLENGVWVKDGASFAAGSTVGDFHVVISGLSTNGGGSYWNKTQVLISYSGIDTGASSNYKIVGYLTVGGLATWNWMGSEEVLSSQDWASTPAIDQSTSTSFRLGFDVGDNNNGTVNIFVVGQGSVLPTITLEA